MDIYVPLNPPNGSSPGATSGERGRKMKKTRTAPSGLSLEDRNILLNFLVFPDYFCIEWFSGDPEVTSSQLVSTVLFLNGRQWIVLRKDQEGCYEWSKKCPREELLADVPAEQIRAKYRKSFQILRKHLPETADNLSVMAGQCLRAGIEMDDLDLLFRAACVEEESHRISSAIEIYDAVLESMEKRMDTWAELFQDTVWRTFIAVIERRAALSLFHPDIKKINHFLCMALERARYIADVRSEASLHLLIGQNYWMSFQHDKAVQHFDHGWGMIRSMEDQELQRRGLQMQGLCFWIKGQLREALQVYEDSLGELGFFGHDDFSLLTALHFALCYTQVGIPQRGLGISETIQNQAQKNRNWPILSCALATTGVIFLEIRQMKNARTYFGKALELARRENIPMADVMSGIGLADIECLEGNYERAAEYFKSLWKLRKSSWYHTLNSSHVFEAGYMLHMQGASPVELSPVIRFLYQLQEGDVNPFMYSIIRKHQIIILEKDTPPRDKIGQLKKLESAVRKCGATLELAKIRIALARLSLEVNEWENAEVYGRKAWESLKTISKQVFPADLEHLVPQEDLSREDRLFDLVIEMGEALSNQAKIEQLLTYIITSISRLTGAERAALFIRDGQTPEVRMAASRNLVKDHLKDEGFGRTMKAIQAAASGGDGKIIQYDESGEDPEHFRRVIITPLKLHNRIIGVLYQDSRFFSFDASPSRIKLLSALASQIAVSIDRARAYDEIALLNEKLIRENRYYIEEKEEFRPFGDIIGSADTLLTLQHLIHKVAPTQSTVLIHGETGTGKELVARAIHRESARHQNPFIRVNCAALPDTLIDSELFGHEKGAFTGAMRMKPGRFELANGGTIFLDEVSELPLPTQSRLLRVLQEREFQRVGGTTTLRSNFRLITASNKDLQKEVKNGRFRADLFYRLNVFPIYIEPLRKRKEDILHLAPHFLKLFCSQYNRQYPGIPEAEMEKLMAYSWPGNIRELSNMIERAVILGGPKIRFAELEGSPVPKESDEELQSLQDVEKAHILRILKKTGGKIGGKNGAAALLDLKRTTLIHRMKKLGIYVDRNMAVPMH